MNRHDHTSFLGAMVTFLGTLTLEDIGILCSILFGLGTFLLNWHYKKKELELKEMQLKKQIEELKNEKK